MVYESEKSMLQTLSQIRKIHELNIPNKLKIDYYDLYFLDPGSVGFEKKTPYNVYHNSLSLFRERFQSTFLSDHIHFSPANLSVYEYASLIKKKDRLMDELNFDQGIIDRQSRDVIVTYRDMIDNKEAEYSNQSHKEIDKYTLGEEMMDELLHVI